MHFLIVVSVILTLLFDLNIIRRCQGSLKRQQHTQRKKVRWERIIILKLHIGGVKVSDIGKLAN